MRQMLERALRLPRRSKCVLQLSTDALLLAGSFLMALVLQAENLSPILQPQAWTLLAVSVPITLVIFLRLGLYRALVRYMTLNTLKVVGIGAAVSTLTLALAARFVDISLTLSPLVIHAILVLLSVGGIRFLMRSLYRRILMKDKIRVIIYGAGSAGSQLVASLRQGTEFMPVAFVDDWRGMNGTTVEGIKVFKPAELPRLIEKSDAERILLAMPSTTRSRRRQILESLERLNVAIQTVPAVEDVVSGRARLEDIRNVSVEDLLGRDPVPARQELLDANIRDKVVMVTGAGGSIGSELCRQIIRLRPSRLLLVEVSEFALYSIESELARIAKEEELPRERIVPLLCSVQNGKQLESLMRTFGVQTVYHAAAYKHVPMVEYNVSEGVINNVFGTLETAKAAVAAGVGTFVLISTDKAVRPTNVMGTTKRMAELICQALSATQTHTRFCMVRFGNVLGSSGSVIPVFRQQIAQGGPVTVTHPEITRFFMTIPEAAELVLQAGAMGKGGDVFALDMGEPVRIATLAQRMIKLSGFEVRAEDGSSGDIDIVYTGLRPGEKLYEEILVGQDSLSTEHPRILSEKEIHWEWGRLEAHLTALREAVHKRDVAQIRQLLLSAPTAYQPNGPICDLEWCLVQDNIAAQGVLAREPADIRHISPLSTQRGGSLLHHSGNPQEGDDRLSSYPDKTSAAPSWSDGRAIQSL
ncbi:polysaccharide biosynthesis protein [Halomonas sp. RA08-2]|uniref:polysaccharide biosynthesis protein n=1 Tax=Halomonas sp. RA08-2 TaxID=3440842 RepID=UPI003EE82F80